MSEGLALQTVTPLVERVSQPLLAAMPIYPPFPPLPFLPSPSSRHRGPGLLAPHKNQLENPVLVSRE